MNSQKGNRFCNEEFQQQNLFEKYIKDTLSLKKIYESDKKEYIVDIKVSENIVGRKFLKLNKEVGYVEMFLDKRKQFMSNLSENITFLFPPNERNEESIIGIRFYKENIIEIKKGYFTLIKKGRNKYEIVEKFENGEFFEEKLDCLEIIKNIIFNKHFKNSDYISGLSFVELIGFYYCAKKDLKDNCIMLDPYNPNPLDKASIKESINDQNVNTLYIEPILYSNHISILLFTYTSNNERNNILLDMSHFHSDYILKDNFLFPKEMKKNLILFPKIPLQLGETCGLWFLSQIYYIINQGFNALKIINTDYINYVTEIINYITDLLSISKFINKVNVNLNDYKAKKFSISKNIVYNPFINVENFFIINNLSYIKFKNIAIKYGKKFGEAREIIIKMEKNFNYYKNQPDDEHPIRVEDLNDLKKVFTEAKNNFEKFFDVAYSFCYGKNLDKDAILYQQLKEDLDSNFDFIDENYKFTSDNCYIYSNEEFKEFYFKNFSYEFNNYFDVFFN